MQDEKPTMSKLQAAASVRWKSDRRYAHKLSEMELIPLR